MGNRTEFVIEPELYVRGEPSRSIGSSHETRRLIRTIDEATAYVREHREGRDLRDREALLRQLDSAQSREQMLDAVNAFRTWLIRENLLFPQS